MLVDELAQIAAAAEREGISEADVRNRRKVLVFSYFGDTVEWIAEHLGSVLATDRQLARYRGRLAIVRGTDSFEGVTRTDAVFGFAPESTEAPPGRADDKYLWAFLSSSLLARRTPLTARRRPMMAHRCARLGACAAMADSAATAESNRQPAAEHVAMDLDRGNQTSFSQLGRNHRKVFDGHAYAL